MTQGDQRKEGQKDNAKISLLELPFTEWVQQYLDIVTSIITPKSPLQGIEIL